MNPAAELIYVLSHHFTAQEQRRHQCLTTLQRSFLSLGCGCTYSVNLLKCLGDHMASAQHLCSGDCVQQMRRVNDTMSLEEKLLFRCGFTMQSPIFNYTPWDKRTSVFLCSAARLKKKKKIQGWTDRARWGELWCISVSRLHFIFSSRCALVQWQLSDSRPIVWWCTVLEEFVMPQPNAALCVL